MRVIPHIKSKIIDVLPKKVYAQFQPPIVKTEVTPIAEPVVETSVKRKAPIKPLMQKLAHLISLHFFK